MDVVTLVTVVAVVVIVAAGAWFLGERRRSERLKERFGPEYERTMDHAEDRRHAEAELKERERRQERFELRSLDPSARRRYAEEWDRVQREFVDTPDEAVQRADRLVLQVMRDRGYPMEDFEQRAADLSVEHPVVVENYRAAHAIAVEDERGTVETEQLRQALVHYRALFEELLEDGHRGPDHDRDEEAAS